MKLFNKYFISFMLVIPNIAFAADSISARATIVTSVYFLITILAGLMGIILMFIAITKLKSRIEHPNNPHFFPSAILVTLFAGAAMFNYSTTAGVVISSLLGSADAGYCFVLDNNIDLVADNCWDSSSSEMLSSIEERVNNMSSGGAGTKIKENAEVIVGLFQVVGLVYFLMGIYGLSTVSTGRSHGGYGKPIITIISSALIIDLPHTIDVIETTIAYLGFGV